MAAGAVLAAAALGALLPSAAIAADTSGSTSAIREDSRAVGAVMLGGWVGGGILVLGTGVIVASASVRRPSRTGEPVQEMDLAEA